MSIQNDELEAMWMNAMNFNKRRTQVEERSEERSTADGVTISALRRVVVYVDS